MPTPDHPETSATSSSRKKADPTGWVFIVATVAGMVAVVIQNLDVPEKTKWWIAFFLIGVFVVAAISGLAWVYRKHPRISGFTNALLLVLLVFTVAVIPVVVFGNVERNLLLTLAGILFLSLLPGWLYLQFVAVKGKTLWNEYVLNLFRLHVDDYRNLPRPPVTSIFYERWQKSQPNGTGDGSANLYERKFRGLYGSSLEKGTGSGELKSYGENLFPVLVSTILLGVAWTMTFRPDVVIGWKFVEGTFGVDRMLLPVEALQFGFLGSYFFMLQMLIRRYYQDDLKTSAYLNATVRIVIVSILVVTVDRVWPDEYSGKAAFAFLVGVFPQLGVQALRSLVAIPLRGLVPSLKKNNPLSDLDGMNIWYESRLLEEGIEDLQNLSTSNLVDVILRTRIPVDRLVDWIDQAHLLLHVCKSSKDASFVTRDKLRCLGIRTATDLENVMDVETTSDPKKADEACVYRWVLNNEEEPPSVTETIVKALRSEPNLYHVRQWKRYAEELEARQKTLENL